MATDDQSNKKGDQDELGNPYDWTEFYWGGFQPSMIGAVPIIDAVIRLLPGVIGNPSSLLEESFNNDLIEHHHYTKPKIWQNIKVPDVLLSGNHKKIKEWRLEKSIVTKKKDS